MRTPHQLVWLKAFSGQSVTLEFSSVAEATSTRFALYEAVRPAKRSRDLDPQLHDAAKNCVLRREGCIVKVFRKDQTPEALKIAEALKGFSVDDSGEFSEEPSTDHKPQTPYYSR